jgi:hypothetical protein
LSEFVSWLNIHVIVLILFFKIIRIFTALSDILFGDVVNVGLSESDRLGTLLLLGVVSTENIRPACVFAFHFESDYNE